MYQSWNGGEPTLIEATVDRFVREHYEFTRLHRRWAEGDDPCRLWPHFAELGLLGLPIAEAMGGIGADLSDLMAVAAVLGGGLTQEPYVDAIVSGAILERAALDATCKTALDSLIVGEEIFVIVDGRDATLGLIESRDRDGTRLLSGRSGPIAYAAQATRWLIIAADGSVHMLDPTSDGVHIEPCTLLDNRPAARVTLAEVIPVHRLPPHLDVDAALRLGLVTRGAEAIGVMAAALNATRDYLNTRKQFGVPLASFQALQHRFADMAIYFQRAYALVRLCTRSLTGDANGMALERLLLAMRIVLGKAARLIGEECIQLHGGIGATDESPVSHFNHRLMVLNRLYLRPAKALVKLWEGQADFAGRIPESAEASAFRAEVKSFVQAALPANIRHKVEQGLYLEKEDYVGWQKILRDKGWFPPSWPTQQGGPGWPAWKQQVFAQEAALNGAPEISPYGVSMVGPVLYTFGSDQQKRDYLPGILASDTWWCQGYSEPNAGSDLASLSLSAVRDGDHYVLNGSKMWTTEAHWADMMHCLARTDKSSKKQQGITFLLIDMKTPGLTIRPIVTADRIHHTNQVFFDDVRVPVANRVGAEGDGWRIAKFLLANERTAVTKGGDKLRMLRLLRQLSARHEPGTVIDHGRMLAGIEADLIALLALEADYLDAWQQGRDDGMGASMLKVLATELHQAMTSLWGELWGPYGSCYLVDNVHGGSGASAEEPEVAAAAGNFAYLFGRIHTIAGGSNEIQRNIIASRVLHA